ncbi:Na/Pi cotransporter family protein [uncultured Propionivibrio sp.]|uniref:Na/Pi cotransporter family protein n=1 Tax=uncultured Propionivibrio sp. TaxID=426737 RepID=UPI0029BFB608|nr:Na/Pi cotransporter family protein [uncultured Propionivibrio sp.]
MVESGIYELTMILGAATLMLWGVRMARTGVMRAYGAEIREILPRTLKNRLVALLAGAGSATILQSSIAVAVFSSTLAALGVIPVADGLVLMLGADAGSAVVAALLTLNLKAMWPLLMFVGYLLHSIYAESDSPAKQYGRILLGIAMVLIALTFMSQVSSALANSELVRIVVSSLGDELLIALLLFALLTWLAHSSIAILLFWASLVQAGITDNAALIVAAILGINVGNAIPPIVMSMNQAAPSRRIVVGHAVIKLSGVFACFVALHLIDRLYALLPGLAGFRVVILHILFNLMLIVVFSWRVDALARFMERFFITTEKPVSEIGPRYIPSAGEDCADAAAFPVLALTREILRILGTIQNMLEAALDMLIAGKHERADDILRMEEKVNTLFKAVRAYAVALTRKGLNETEQRRVTALLRYTANLENAGDVICKTMLRIPESMKKSGKQFSDEGKTELERLFRFLIGTTQLSAEVIMAWHPDTANLLVQRKRDMKAMCHDSSRQHIGRLSQGHSDALSSSSAHLDLISDLRWISTQISSIGYDVLPESDSPGQTAEEKLATHPE